MIEESNYGDAYSLDIEASKAAVEKYGEFIDEYEKKEQAEQAVEAEKTAEQKQRVDEQVDPRNADSWGAKAFIKEGQSILSGGIQDTASSIATFPERTIDAISGEMQREKEKKDSTNQSGLLLILTITLSKPKHGGVNSYVA